MSPVLLAVAVGIASTALMSELPGTSGWWVATVLAVLCLCWRRSRLVGFGLVGFVYALWFGQALLSHQLPHDLELEPLLITGEVLGPVEVDERRIRFDVQIESAEMLRTGQSVALQKVRLSHYRPRSPGTGPDWVVPAVGDQWTWVARLRRPRGFANPGGFDYQASLLRSGLSGSGYISDYAVRRSQAVPLGTSSLEDLRIRAAEQIDQRLNEESAALLKALVLGDKSGFAPEQWQLFRSTGTVHLVVISGLHIGMLAGIGFAVGLWPGRLLSVAGYPWPAQWWGALSALLLASIYAALAGFSLPTQRALAMVCCGLLMLLMRRQVSLWSGYCLALLIVLIINPLAVTGSGFWLSFMAVAALLVCLQGRQYGYLQALLLTQAAVTVGLFPWLMFWHGEVPLPASMVNLVAVPWVGVAVLPLGFLTLLLALIFSELPQGLWLPLQWALETLLVCIQWSADYLGGQLSAIHHQVPLWVWVASFVGVALVLAPWPWRIRWLGLLPLFGLLASREVDPPALRLVMLDVGQGLAAMVQVDNRVLIYDTGPEFSPDFNAGTAVIAPALEYYGVRHVDRLVVSHRHQDHAGGVAGLTTALPVSRIIAGEPEHLDLDESAEPCSMGSGWRWDAVDFRLLHVGELLPGGNANDLSCVVLVTHGETSILLSGDIERRGEAALLAEGVLPRNITVLQVPHHGSNTSSTSAFLQYLQPEAVIFPRGYKHRFGHPHPEVTERVKGLGGLQFDTALQGAIVIEWHDDGHRTVTCWRDRMSGYWIDRVDC